MRTIFIYANGLESSAIDMNDNTPQVSASLTFLFGVSKESLTPKEYEKLEKISRDLQSLRNEVANRTGMK